MFDFIKKGAARLRSLFFLIIFPKRCLLCAKFDSYFCVDCQSKMKLSLYKDNKNGLDCYSLFFYKEPGFASLIHAFKYAGVEDVFADLQNLLLNKRELLLDFLPLGNFYYLPVPLHRKRLRERGYNQADELAKIFQQILPGTILNNLVQRIKYNKAQAKLGRADRLVNLKGIFALNEFDFSQIKPDDYLLLVDDVLTTGSTLSEIYALLKDKWAGKIIAVVLARD